MSPSAWWQGQRLTSREKLLCPLGDLSPQSARPLPGRVATPLRPHLSLCSAGHLDTWDSNKVLTGSRGAGQEVPLPGSGSGSHSPSNADEDTGGSPGAAEPQTARSSPAQGRLSGDTETDKTGAPEALQRAIPEGRRVRKGWLAGGTRSRGTWGKVLPVETTGTRGGEGREDKRT